MQAVVAHEFFPHVSLAGLGIGALVVARCVRKLCVTVCCLSGWLVAAGILYHTLRAPDA